jgi:tellurium resistance protein TerD
MITLDLNKSSGTLNLTKDAPTMKTVRGLLNWDVNVVHGKSLTQGFDLDIFAFVLDSNSKITSGSDVVYYGNKNYVDGSISVPIDNRTGEGDNDEHIDLKLDKVPAGKDFVDIYVIIHDAANRGQNFSMMANSSFKLSDVENKVDLVKYELSQYTNETSVLIGRFSRVGSGWEFTPYGDAAVADPNTIVGLYQ